MHHYLIRRLLALIPVLLGITLLAFVMGVLAPGDPALMIYMARFQEPPSDNAVIEELREELGLNAPLPVRYLSWVARSAQGDLGFSYRTGQPVLAELVRHVAVTLRLSIIGVVATLLIATPLGIIAAVYHDSILDLLLRLVSLAGTSMPSFWLAYLLIFLFAVQLGWLPVAGTGSWRHLVLPSIAVSTFGISIVSRLLRSSLLEVLDSDFVRAARARGVPQLRVILGHALRNALIPVVTVMGSLFGHLTAGAVVIETVFAMPGVGRLIIDAIGFRDYPVIQGFVVFSGTLFVLVNLLVDLTYTFVDPRVRLASRGGSHG